MNISCLFVMMAFQVKIKSEPLSDEAYDDGVVIDGSYPDSEVCYLRHYNKKKLTVLKSRHCVV